MKTEIPVIDVTYVQNVAKMDFLGEDLVIFDDISQVPLFDYPTHINAAVFSICLEGSIRIGINLQEYTITPGTLVVLMPDQTVQHFGKSDDFSGIFLGVSRHLIDDTIPSIQKLLNAFFYVREHPCTSLSREDLDNLTEYHSILWKKVRMKDHIYRKEIIQSLLLSLFYDVCNIFARHKQIKEKGMSRRDELFSQFIREVMLYYKEERSVKFYADKMCVTPKYLSQVIKEVSGKTAGTWIDEYVTLEAKALLKSSSLNIQEISDVLHFANQSFFGKYFKQQTGMSPKTYRNG